DASVYQPQSGDGWQIGLTWKIDEGPHEGRYVFQNITFVHSNTQAVQIGRRQFKDLCVATGISEQVADVEQFKFIRCRIKVGIERDTKQGIYPDKNRVSRILPLEDTKSPKTGPVGAAPKTGTEDKPASEAAQPASSTDTPPWRKTVFIAPITVAA